MRASGLKLAVIGENRRDLPASGQRDRSVQVDRIERPDPDRSSWDARSSTARSTSSRTRPTAEVST
jgi:hypothetical protein